jgi:hypothetical protein
MKSAVLLSLLLAAPAYADGPMDFTSAREIRTAGKSLTAVGIIAHIASIPLVALAASQGSDPDIAFVASGAALTAVSALSVGIGVGLWGASDRFDRNEKKVAVSPFGMSLRF